MGRLFDGIAALVGVGGIEGLGARVSFEAEAAMALEFAADRGGVRQLSAAARRRCSARRPRARTGRARDPPRARLAAAGRGAARRPRPRRVDRPDRRALPPGAGRRRPRRRPPGRWAAGGNVTQVALSGGCFQNRRLSERLAAALRAADFTVLCTAPCRPTTAASHSDRSQSPRRGSRRTELAEPRGASPCVSVFQVRSSR